MLFNDYFSFPFLDRSLWLFLSLLLSNDNLIPPEVYSTLEGIPSNEDLKVEILTQLMRFFYLQGYSAETTPTEDPSQVSQEVKSSEPIPPRSSELEIYESACLAIFSRLMAIPQYRLTTKSFLMSLKHVPSSCLSIIGKIIATKSADSDSKELKTLRSEALIVAAQCIFSSDEVAGYGFLDLLLRYSLSSDFELHSKAINVIAK